MEGTVGLRGPRSTLASGLLGHSNTQLGSCDRPRYYLPERRGAVAPHRLRHLALHAVPVPVKAEQPYAVSQAAPFSAEMEMEMEAAAHGDGGGGDGDGGGGDGDLGDGVLVSVVCVSPFLSVRRCRFCECVAVHEGGAAAQLYNCKDRVAIMNNSSSFSSRVLGSQPHSGRHLFGGLGFGRVCHLCRRGPRSFSSGLNGHLPYIPHR